MKTQHPKDPHGLVELIMDASTTLLLIGGTAMFLAWLYDPALIR